MITTLPKDTALLRWQYAIQERYELASQTSVVVVAIVTTFRTWGAKGVWGRCPQPAFDLSAQAEGGSTVRLSAHAEAPAPRPNPSVSCYTC